MGVAITVLNLGSTTLSSSIAYLAILIVNFSSGYCRVAISMDA